METTSIIGTKTTRGQVYTDPRVMMNEAPRTPSFFTGSEVIKEAVKRANVDVMVAYPPYVGSCSLKGISKTTSAGRVNLRSCRSAQAPHSAGPVSSRRPPGRAPCGPWKTSRCGPGHDCRSNVS